MVKPPYGIYNLKAIRKQVGLTMRQVYEAAHMTCTEYARYENGKPMSQDIAERIAHALNMTVEELIHRDDIEDMKWEMEDPA